jgi:hypothetical protein
MVKGLPISSTSSRSMMGRIARRRRRRRSLSTATAIWSKCSLILRLQRTSTIANASGGSVDVRRLPAPLTIDRIELLLDSSSVFETIYGDALYLETLYSNNEPKFAREATAGQFGEDPGNGADGMQAEITVADGAATPQVTTRLRLLTMLQTAKICPKALSTDVVIRVYHHKHNHNKGGTAGITGTFTQPRLWIRSTVLTHSEQNRLTSMYQ